MATARWKIAIVDESTLVGIYDDVTMELFSVEVNNPSKTAVRLTVNRLSQTTVLKVGAKESVPKALEVKGPARTVQVIEGKINLPLGTNIKFETQSARG